MIQKPRAKRHYINNRDFYEAMVKYRDECRDAKARGANHVPQVPRYVGECIMLICEKLSTKPNFMNYSYRDEMVGDAIENCLSSVSNFNPDKSVNPFAYFTQIAWNAFIRRITREKKQSYIKHKNYENSGIMDELWDMQYAEGGSGHSVQSRHNHYSDEIIRSFEEKLTKNSRRGKVGIEKFTGQEENADSTDN